MSKRSLIGAQKLTISCCVRTKIPSKVVLHVKMPKNYMYTVFSQSSAAVTSVQMKMCWVGPPWCFTAAGPIFYCKIPSFLVSLSIHSIFVLLFFHIDVSLQLWMRLTSPVVGCSSSCKMLYADHSKTLRYDEVILQWKRRLPISSHNRIEDQLNSSAVEQ